MNVQVHPAIDDAAPACPSPAFAGEDAVGIARADMLARVASALDAAEIAWCTLGAPEQLRDPGPSDVDLLVDAAPQRLRAVLASHPDTLAAELVLARDGYLVFARTLVDGRVATLALDAVRDVRVDAAIVLPGDTILATREKVSGGHAPAPAHAFAITLARTLAKRAVGQERIRRLAAAFDADSDGARREAAALLGAKAGARVCAAIVGGTFEQDAKNADALRALMVARARRARPVRFLIGGLGAIAGRARRFLRPDGLSVVMLGPDGAGKSSTIEALERDDLQIFSRIDVRGFAPRMLDSVRPRIVSTDEPHALAPRSPLASCVRALWWLAYYRGGSVETRLARARGTLILYDRHFVDIFVDRRRYRYGGPDRLLRLVWALVPKPDLVVLLDAPAEVLQSRKQEVPFEVTKRQRDAYRALVETLPMGRIVDAAQPREAVVESVRKVLLEKLAGRERREAA